MSYMDFSSWPREQEQSFVVYEQQRARVAEEGVHVAAIVAGIGVFVARWSASTPASSPSIEGPVRRT